MIPMVLVWRERLMMWLRSLFCFPIRSRGLSANRGAIAGSWIVVRARMNSCIHLSQRALVPPNGARLEVTSATHDARYLAEPACMHLPSPVVGVE